MVKCVPAFLVLFLIAPCAAFATPKPDKLRATRNPPSNTKLGVSTMSEKELLEVISDDSYAMDISSITKGSELETYIGQGSGVNEGAGMGRLAGFIQKLVGKILTRKNKPIFEKLWTIIEDDLLTMVQERTPTLEKKRTWFVPKGSTPEAYTFETEDGTCEGSVECYKGGRIDWITTCKFFSKSLGFGNLRIDGWTNRETRAPHMSVHLCIVFNVIFIYINLIPRTNLVLDDDYNDYVYGSPKDAIGGKSLNDLHVQCVEDKSFKQYVSKSVSFYCFICSRVQR